MQIERALLGPQGLFIKLRCDSTLFDSKIRSQCPKYYFSFKKHKNLILGALSVQGNRDVIGFFMIAGSQFDDFLILGPEPQGATVKFFPKLRVFVEIIDQGKESSFSRLYGFINSHCSDFLIRASDFYESSPLVRGVTRSELFIAETDEIMRHVSSFPTTRDLIRSMPLKSAFELKKL